MDVARFKKRSRWLIATVVLISLAGVFWLGTRPVVIATSVVVLRLNQPQSLDELLISYELARPGGAGDTLIAADHRGNFYLLGVKGTQEVVLIASPEGKIRSCILPAKLEAARHSRAFAVSSSGERWWMTTYFKDPKLTESPPSFGIVDVVTARSSSGELLQQWRKPSSGLGLIGAVGEDSLYVADEEGALWIYQIGIKVPRRIKYPVPIASVIDQRGRVWSLQRRQMQDQDRLFIISPASATRSESKKITGQPSQGNGWLFWQDGHETAYCDWHIQNVSQNPQLSSRSVYVITVQGKMHKLMNIPSSLSITTQNGQARLSRRLLKVEGDVVFGEVVVQLAKGLPPVEHHIVKTQSVPRWRAWLRLSH